MPENRLPGGCTYASPPLRFRRHFWVGARIGSGMENEAAPLRVVRVTRRVRAMSIRLGRLFVSGLDGVRNPVGLPAVVGDPGLLPEMRRVAAMPTARS